jgi:hypothetical protein
MRTLSSRHAGSKRSGNDTIWSDKTCAPCVTMRRTVSVDCNSLAKPGNAMHAHAQVNHQHFSHARTFVRQ